MNWGTNVFNCRTIMEICHTPCPRFVKKCQVTLWDLSLILSHQKKPIQYSWFLIPASRFVIPYCIVFQINLKLTCFEDLPCCNTLVDVWSIDHWRYQQVPSLLVPFSLKETATNIFKLARNGEQEDNREKEQMNILYYTKMPSFIMLEKLKELTSVIFSCSTNVRPSFSSLASSAKE